MKTLALQMSYPPDAKVSGVSKYVWQQLPNNWLSIQEITIKELRNFRKQDVSVLHFPVHNSDLKKTFKVTEPELDVVRKFHIFKKDAYGLIGECDHYHLMSSDTGTLWGGVDRARITWMWKIGGTLDVELAKIAQDHAIYNENSLDQIENVVSSVIKRDPTQLTKADFSFIYAGTDGRWKSFYPTIQQLVDFHILRNEEINESYVEFLNGPECAVMRAAWDISGAVRIKE